MAIIAIIQSLTAAGTTESSLGALREAAGGVHAAASTIGNTADDLRALSASMLQSSEDGRKAIDNFREEISKKISPSSSAAVPIEGSIGGILVDELTFGAGGAAYAAACSYQTSKWFSFDDIFPSDINTFYEDGVISGLEGTGVISIINKDLKIRVIKMAADPEALKKAIRENTFSNTETLGTFQKRLDAVDVFFQFPTNGKEVSTT